MTDFALSDADRAALMQALESRSPVVRQARVAHALLLLAKGLPSVTVADLLFLPESGVCQYRQAFAHGTAAASAAFDGPAAEDRVEDRPAHVSLARTPPRALPVRPRWLRELRSDRQA